jgi:hypothetical protein
MESSNAFKKEEDKDEEVSFFGYVSNKFHEKVNCTFHVADLFD